MVGYNTVNKEEGGNEVEGLGDGTGVGVDVGVEDGVEDADGAGEYVSITLQLPPTLVISGELVAYHVP